MKLFSILTLLFTLSTFSSQADRAVSKIADDAEFVSYAGCVDVVQKQANLKVWCTSGNITVTAYLDGVFANQVNLSPSSTPYCFIRQNSSQTLKLDISYCSGGYYQWTYC